jgi:hypothetical protein
VVSDVAPNSRLRQDIDVWSKPRVGK